MGRLIGWLSSKADRVANQIFDPNREQRLKELGKQLVRVLRRRGSDFDLDQAGTELGIDHEDVQPAAQCAYTEMLARAWKDAALTAKERKQLKIIQRLLQVDGGTARTLEWDLSVHCSSVCSFVR